jgi:hypothetical protein
MDYGSILKRAWEITWRWKILWILGFLASLGGGGGGGQGVSYSTGGEDWDRWWGQGYYAPHDALRDAGGIVAVIIGIACLAVIIGIAIWVVSVIARGGLIAGVQQVEEQEHTAFGLAWRAGARRFWTLFGISFLAGIPILLMVVVGIVVLIVMFAGSGMAFNNSEAAGGIGIVTSILCGGVFCCGLVIVSIVLQQIRIYAERAAILEDLGWIEAFVRGWNVLKANIAPTIVFWAIFFAIGLVLLIPIMAAVAAVALPFVAIVSTTEPGWWMAVPVCFGGLLAVILASLISAIVETFTSATWTLAYSQMAGLVVAAPVAPSEEPAPEV